MPASAGLRVGGPLGVDGPLAVGVRVAVGTRARPQRRTAALAALVLLWCAVRAPHPAAAQDLALANAVVINPVDESVDRGVLVIRDGVVTGLAATVPPDFTGRVLDLEGRFVMPAPADLHTHSFGNMSPRGMPQMLGPQGTANAALFTGVGFVLDLFSPEQMIFEYRNRRRDEGGLGAELFAAGPCLTATNGHCSEYGVPTRIVDTPEEARQEVTDLAGFAPDVVKIVYDHQTYGGRSMPTVDLPTLTAVLETARAHGLKTVVHVGTWDDLREAALAGADAVTHTPGPDAVPAGLAEILAEQGTYHIPTLAVQGDFARMADDPGLLDDPLLIETTPAALRNAYRVGDGWDPRIVGFLTWQRTLMDTSLEAVRALADAGVPMLAGTDGGNMGVFQGYSVHRELELLVEAGLSEWSALRSATTNAARFLERSWGVAPGDEATLLILEASPIESITNTKRVHAVVQAGIVVDRESLLN